MLVDVRNHPPKVRRVICSQGRSVNHHQLPEYRIDSNQKHFPHLVIPPGYSIYFKCITEALPCLHARKTLFSISYFSLQVRNYESRVVSGLPLALATLGP